MYESNDARRVTGGRGTSRVSGHGSIGTKVRGLVAPLALALSLAVGLAPSAQAKPAPTDPVTQGVHVVGDSITYRAHAQSWSPLNGAHRPVNWTADHFPGRRVTALNAGLVRPTTDYWTAVRHMFHPPRQQVSTLVVALGTNGAKNAMTVAEATQMYASGVRRMRSALRWRSNGPKRVILVTPWKAPHIVDGAVNAHGQPYPSYQWSDQTNVYRAAIQRVARATAGVCVMPWHVYAERHPERFRDGVHPDRLGVKVWRNMVYRAIRTCR